MILHIDDNEFATFAALMRMAHAQPLYDFEDNGIDLLHVVGL